MDPINLSSPITSNSAIFGNGDPRITESLIVEMNKSPLLVEWVNRYNSAIEDGTHIPMANGEGRYFKLGEQGNDTLGNAIPGVIRVPIDALDRPSTWRFVGTFSHELAHFIYINSPQGQADAARITELLSIGSNSALTPGQSTELYTLVRKNETVADFGSDMVVDSIYGPSSLDLYHSRQAVNDLGPNTLSPIDYMSAVGERMVAIELAIEAQTGSVGGRAAYVKSYISDSLARARNAGVEARSIEVDSDLALDGSRTITIISADGTANSLRVKSDLTSVETVRQISGEATITTRAAPISGESKGAILTIRTETPKGDGSFDFTERDGNGVSTVTGNVRYFDDPGGRSSITTIIFPNGDSQTIATNTDGLIHQRTETSLQPNGASQSKAYDGSNNLQSTTTTTIDNEGGKVVSTQYPDGRINTDTYNDDGSLYGRDITTPTPWGTELIRTTPAGEFVLSITRQTDDDGNVLEIITNADGSGSGRAIAPNGSTINQSSFEASSPGGSPTTPVHLADGPALSDIFADAEFAGDYPGAPTLSVPEFSIGWGSWVTPKEPYAEIPVVTPVLNAIGELLRPLTNGIKEVLAAIYTPPPSLPRCFAGSTSISLADGTTKPIASIQAGDAVLAFDGLGRLQSARVTRTYAYDPADVIELWAEGAEQAIAATPLHRFLTAEGVYKPLGTLSPGERLIGADGNAITLNRLSAGATAVPVYNFTVEEFHSYVAGGIRVHNQKPIVIDLDGDNSIELIGLDESGVFFDLDENGFKENTAWVSGSDGILAWDREGDGLVTSAREFVFALYGQPGATDLEGLRAGFDTNHDGVFDASDAEFAKTGVWRDANQNGVSEANEFTTLAGLGITAISLTSDGVKVEENGNLVFGKTTFTRADGSVGVVADVDLATDLSGFAETRRLPNQSELINEVGDKAVAVVEGASARSLIVGLGDTRIGFGSSGNDWLMATGANGVTLSGGAGNDVLIGGAQSDVLKGGTGADMLLGGAGDDTLYIDAADLTRRVDGGAGRDIARVASLGAVALDLGLTNIELAVGNGGDDHFFTSDADDIEAAGGDGNDTLEGGAGNDVLIGGAGADTLTGGAGNDTLLIDAQDAQAAIDAGTGIDTVLLEDQANISFDLGAANAEYAVGGGMADHLFTSGAGAVSIAGAGGDDTIAGGMGADTLAGGAGNDLISGGGGDDTIVGGLGDDRLMGGAGNDHLLGGEGSDLLEGGDGNDVLIVDAGDRLSELSGGAGEDVLYVADGRGATLDVGAAQIETAFGDSGNDHLFTSGATGIVVDGGAGNDILGGGTGVDQLVGGAGNDYLEGGEGADTLIGGIGSDRFAGGAGDDVLVIDSEDANADIDGGAGRDTVVITDAAGVFFDLGLSHVEEAQGGAGFDRLYTSGPDAISVLGGGGNDQLFGGAGNDTLSGGAGADTIRGGAGDDRLVIDADDRQIDIDGGAGLDNVSIEGLAGRTFDAGLANVEIVQGSGGADNLLTSTASAVELHGAAGNDVVTGGAGNDTLVGDAGSDTFKGGAGNDTLVVDADDLITNIDGGAGYDTVVIEDARGATIDLGSANAERGMGGVGADVLTTSGSGAVLLEGQGGNDRLQGGTGNDTLIGGAGADTLLGGAGADTLVIDAEDLLATIDGGAGIDTVMIEDASGLAFDLGMHAVERAFGDAGADVLSAGSAMNVYLDGREGNDTLTGGSGNDTLVGGAGADSLTGGAGDDVIFADADDVLVSGGAGRDRLVVEGSRGVTADLGTAQIEVATGGTGNDFFFSTGSGAVMVTGEAGADRLVGGTGDDQLDGGIGDDALEGGAGADVLLGGLGDDRLTGGSGKDLLDGGAGTDTAIFSGRASDYRVTSKLTALGGDGQLHRIAEVMDLRTGEKDALLDVEQLTFSDRTMDLAASSHAPVATPDRLRAYKETPITISGALVTKNDWDLDSSPFWIAGVANASGGTAAFDYAKQKIVFTPDAGFVGLASFDYTVRDITGNLSASTVTVEVDPFKPTDLPTDTLFPTQWNLFNTGQTGGRAGYDLNVAAVWEDYTGQGITVANLEGQVEYTNSELADNYDTSIDYDFRDGDNDPLIRLPSTEGHSNATSGFIVADRNGVGLVGVAYDASLFIPAVGADGRSAPTLFDEAIDFSWRQGADVNNFIGIYVAPSGAPSHHDVQPVLTSLRNATTFGREGLGMVTAITGGNEYGAGYDTSYWAPTSSRYVATVAAMMPDGSTTAWATPGAGILVTAPGQFMPSVDVSGSNGYSTSDYYLFSGTCGSTPHVAGVMALMLDANAGLGYRDVYEILAYSSTLTADEAWQWQDNGATNWNGGGLHVSHRAGYGLVDARAAVRLAETWQSVSTAANELVVSGSAMTSRALVDNGAISDSVTVGAGVTVDRVEIDLNISHAWVGDLIVTLISPDGTESVLVSRPGKNPDDPNALGASSQNFVYTVGSTHHYGESSGGVWTLRVEDARGGYTGTLNSWTLRLYGDAETVDDTYIYTNEYIRLGGEENASRRTLSDTDGIDTINAAAVNYDTTLDLGGEIVSSIAMQDFTISANTVIENAFTGDGSDHVVGNAVANILDGGRGNDNLSGKAGDDILRGGRGDDMLSGGEGADEISGGDGIDTATYAASQSGVTIDLSTGAGAGGDAEGDHLSGIERVLASAFDDVLTGDDGNNEFHGNGGDDQIDGGAGEDTVYFGGNANDYQYSYSAGRVIVTDRRGIDGTDSLGGVELMQFSDQTVRVFAPGENAPVVSVDQISATEDTPLTISAAALLANDFDADGDAFTVTSVESGTHGQVALDAQGNIVFTPDADYAGEAVFSYTATDATGRSSSASVHVDVENVNDAPVLQTSAIQVTEDVERLLSQGLLASDVEGDALSILAFDAVTAAGGTLTQNSSGELVYRPATDFYGQDSFSYTVSDGHGGVTSGTAAIAVAPVNDAPRTQADTFTINEDSSLVVTVAALMANDQEVEGDAMTFAGVSNAINGAVSVNGLGQVVFTPAANIFGPAGFDYTLTDVYGATTTQHVAVTIAPVQDAPIARADFLIGAQNTPLTISLSTLLSNDFDPDGDALTVSSVGNAANGAVAFSEDGKVVFTPNENFSGTAAFDYTISDGNGGSATQTAVVSVQGQQAGPRELNARPEFRMNGNYFLSRVAQPALAALAGGGFVEATEAGDGSGVGVVGQRYDAYGHKVGMAFRMNSYTTDMQGAPALAGLADGGFVAVWDSLGQDGSGYGSYGQRYDPNGNRVGGEFRLNSYSTNNQRLPALTALTSGGFVAIWEADAQDGSGVGVYGQRYDANGNRAGSEFRLNSYTNDNQYRVVLTALTDGGFVAAWESYVGDGSSLNGWGIFGQRFDANGNPTGGEFRMNTYDPGLQLMPALTGLTGGGFVATWESRGQDGGQAAGYGGYSDLYGQRFDSNGIQLGGEFLINTSTSGQQGNPTVAALGDGGFVVVWDLWDWTGGSTQNSAVFGQRYAANGDRIGGEFLIDSGGLTSAVVGLANGGFVVKWGSGNGYGEVFGRVYEPVAPPPPELTAASQFVMHGSHYRSPNPRPALTALVGGGFVEATETNDGNSSGVSAQRYDASGNKLGSAIRLNSYTTGLQQVPVLTGLSDGGFVAAWESDGQDGSELGSYAQRFDASGNAVGGEFRLNTYTLGYQWLPTLVGLANGGFVAAWQSGHQDGSNNGLYGQRYDANGNRAGSEFRLNTTTTYNQMRPSLTAMAEGGFVAAWDSTNAGDTSVLDVVGQRYDASGNPVGGEFLINSAVPGSGPAHVKLVSLMGGDFVATWETQGRDGDGYGIYGQRFAANGDRIGEEFRVNTSTIGSQRLPAVTALTDGGFVATWESFAHFGAFAPSVYGQRYAANGDRVGGEFLIAASGLNAAVAGLSNGGFVVKWGEEFTDGKVLGRIYAPANTAPLAREDAIDGIEDQPLVFTANSLLANDSDVEGHALSLQSVLNASNGSVVLNADGTIQFTPTANFSGTAGFDYTIVDSNGAAATAHVTVNVSAVNDAPVAATDTFVTNEDQLLNVAAAQGALANDSDVESNALIITGFDAVSAHGGTVTMQADGSFSYRPAENFRGSDSFTYFISDGQGGSATSTVNLQVTSVNDAPVAGNDSFATAEGEVLLVAAATGVLANDGDVDGNALTVTGWEATSLRGGTVAMNADGSFTYIPLARFAGIDSFHYTVSDGQGGFVTGEVSLNVAAGAGAPHVADDTYAALEDGELSVSAQFGLLNNDSNPSGAALAVSGFDAVTAEGGAVSVNADGSFTYRPRADFHGTDSFTYVVSDGQGATAAATARIAVQSVNDAPVAQSDSFATTSGVALELSAASLLANDSDGDGGTLQIADVDQVSEAGGSIVAGVNGGFVYQTAAGFSGTDKFSYRVSDGQGGISDAWITIAVAPQAGSPTPANDVYTVDEDGVMSVAAASGVLANDSDPDGGALTVTAYDQQSEQGGFVVMQANGGFSYIPPTDFYGEDSFSYTVSDSTGKRSTASVTLTVNPVAEVEDPSSRPLVLHDDFYTMDEDGVLSASAITGVIGINNRDADGNLVTVTAYDAVTTHGVVAMNPDGSFSFTPNADYNGRDSFTYTIGNGHGATASATVTVTVNSVNDLPAATNDTAEAVEDVALVINASALLANDADPEGDTLSIASVGNAQHGTVALGPDGNVVFTAALNYAGQASFEYVAADGNGGFATATVAVTVGQVNDAPDAGADVAATVEDTAFTLFASDLLANDADAEGDALSIVSVHGAIHGSVFLSVDGAILFTPDADFHGLASFDYTAIDAQGLETTAHVAVAIASVNDTPTAQGNVANGFEDTPLLLRPSQLLANDADADGDIVNVRSVGNATHGSVTINSSGNIVFTPEIGFHGMAGFSYTVDDGQGGFATAEVSLAIAAVNDTPTATADEFSVAEDGVLTIELSSLTGNDADIDGDAVSVGAVGNAVHGQVTIVNGQVVFRPNANFYGQASFDYALTDGNGGVSYATVAVNVLSINDLPTAVADSVVTQEESSLLISAARLLGNDRDADGDTLQLLSVSNAQNGQVTLDGNGQVQFTPDADFSGVASFDYVVTDGISGQSSARVSVVVTPINDMPIVVADSFFLNEDQQLVLSRQALLGNDTDADGDLLSVVSVGNAAHGVVSLNASGNIVFNPDANFHGQASFGYTVTDHKGGTTSGSVSLDIVSVNDAPVLSQPLLDVAATEDLAFSYALPVDAFAEADLGDSLALSATLANGDALPSWLVFDAASRTFTGMPVNQNVGEIAVRVTATDTAGASAVDTFTLTVANTNDAPALTAAIDNQVATEDAAFTFVVPTASFIDVDLNDALTYSATLANGDPLPLWLTFNAATQTFSGTPVNGDVGILNLRITATDLSGVSAAGSFALNVANTNDAPVLASALVDANVAEDTVFSYTVPAGTFTDIDAGDVLTYTATLANGDPLPSWLTFDEASRTFSGTPLNQHVGTLSVSVTATDAFGTTATSAFEVGVTNTNDAPVLGTAMGDQTATEDQPFSFTISGSSFVDQDLNDSLSYSATLADGSPLPSWLSLNTATGAFTGVPANGDVGVLNLSVTATDASGAAVSTSFVLTVGNVNDAPTAALSLGNKTATEDATFSFTIPAESFADVDTGDTLSYTVLLADGDSLPAWLNFDAATQTFSGIPLNADVGQLSLSVTATDASGASASSTFGISVGNTNDGPSLAAAVSDQTATEDQTFSFTLAGNTFTDEDAGDSLSYTASLVNGDALPSWLSFDAATGVFSGTPTNANVGTLAITLTATDESGTSVTDTFSVAIANVNDAPVVARVIDSHTTAQNQAFSFTLPANTFTDIDAGDTLVLSATLENGDALPGWLNFDAATSTFAGTPANGDVGVIGVTVTATDAGGLTVSSNFDMSISNVNDAPVVAQALSDQSTTQGQSFNFTVPALTFVDMDAGDMLVYTATLANGDPLPSWLSFDAATGTFSGTPANDHVGALNVRVAASDSAGASASSVFTLSVFNLNDGPVLAQPLADATVAEDAAFSYTLPANAFSDMDTADQLTYAATLANGDALPTWLSFNAATGTFSGTPANADVGNVDVRVTATDTSGAQAADVFSIAIANTNDAPVVAQAIANGVALEDQAFSFTIPGATFTDVDGGDTLVYTAIQANGNPLPSWLTFNAAAGTFSGTPTNGDVGGLSITVTATDGQGAAASSTFTLDVANVNDAPTLASPIVDQVATEDAAFAFTLPAHTFSDVDAGDSRSYTATLANGNALPAWLSFNAATGTFSGTPDNENVGTVSVLVTATDASGVSASDVFSLNVSNTNDTPVAGNDLGSAAEDGGPVTLTAAILLANDADVDAGDSKRISAVEATSAAGATVTLVNGNVVYNPGSLFQSLAQGATTTDTFSYTVSDDAGASSTATVTMTITGTNDAPVLVLQTVAQTATQGTAFTLALPAGKFSDVDTGTSLSWSASLTNGSPLPSWLVFNAATRTFSGTPGSSDVGAFTLRVTATDPAGASATESFALTVQSGNTQGQTFIGTSGNDTLNGTPYDDILDGRAGNDTLNGGAGRDIMTGGTGSDKLLGEAGDDTLGFGVDAIWTGSHHAANVGSPGNAGSGETVSLSGKSRSHDIFNGGAGYDALVGTNEHDALFLDDSYSPPDGYVGPRIQQIELISMEGGNDVVDLTSRRYAYGDVTIDGGTGNDVLWASSGNDRLLGGDGNDELDGGAGNDILDGGAGNDDLRGGVGVSNDILSGGAGNDTLDGGAGDDVLDGGAGHDNLAGGLGNDIYLHGLNGGANVISERGGQDVIRFTAGISSGAVSVTRHHNDLVLKVAGQNGSVTVEDWFDSSAERVERVEFADGTVWDENALRALARGESGSGWGGGGGGNFNSGHHDRNDDHSSYDRGESRDKKKADQPDSLANAINQINERLAAAPRHDFGSLAAYLSQQSSTGPLTAAQIARQWNTVKGSIQRLGQDDDGTRQGVQGGSFGSGDDLVQGAMHWGFAGSVGQSGAAGGMASLNGLSEGFKKLN